MCAAVTLSNTHCTLHERRPEVWVWSVCDEVLHIIPSSKRANKKCNALLDANSIALPDAPQLLGGGQPDPLKVPGMIARKFQPSILREAGILHTPTRPYRCSVINVFVFLYIYRCVVRLCLPFYRFLTAHASVWQLRILRNIWLYGRDRGNVSRVIWVLVSSWNREGDESFCCLPEMGQRISRSSELIRPHDERDKHKSTFHFRAFVYLFRSNLAALTVRNKKVIPLLKEPYASVFPSPYLIKCKYIYCN